MLFSRINFRNTTAIFSLPLVNRLSSYIGLKCLQNFELSLTSSSKDMLSSAPALPFSLKIKEPLHSVGRSFPRQQIQAVTSGLFLYFKICTLSLVNCVSAICMTLHD